MIDQPQRFLDSLCRGDAAISSAIDQGHWKPEGSGRGDLAVGGITAAIFGDDHVDAMFLQERDLVLYGEGTAGEEIFDRRRGQGRVDRIDAANEVVVLRSGVEMEGLLSADGEEHATRLGAKHFDGFPDRGDGRPAVAFDGLPPGPFEPDQRRFANVRRALGIGGNLPGERMGRVDQQVYSIACKVAGQPLRAAEAAGTDGDWLGGGIDRAAGERQGHVEIGALGEPARQFARFPRAAQNEDVSLAHA